MTGKILKAFIKHNLRFFLLLVLCSAICFSALVTFRTLERTVSHGLNGYLADYDYYDGLLQPYYGTFLPGDADKIREIPGIEKVQEAFLSDSVLLSSDETHYVRLIGIDLTDRRFYITEETDSGDLYLSAEFADNMGIHAGDTIRVKLSGQEISFKIKAISNDPNLMGAIRSIAPTLELSSLGYAYLSPELLGKYTDVSLPNTLLYFLRENADSEAVRDEIKDLFKDRQLYFEENENRNATRNVKNDLGILEPIAEVLPLAMYLIGLVISVLFLRQFIEIKKRDIEILRSNGVSKTGVVRLFVDYALCVSVSACLLGVLLSVIQARLYVNLYSDAIYLPRFQLKMGVIDILFASLLTLFITVASVFINIRQITHVDIVETMNGNAPTQQAAVKLFRNKAISVKPFLAPIFGKPAMFFFSLINMILVCVIVTGSLSVRSAKEHSVAYTYDSEIGHDYVLHYFSYARLENNGDTTYKETALDINGETARLFVLNNTDYVHVFDENERPLSLGDGIILYAKLADELGVQKGDTVEINGQSVTVDAICKAVTDFKCYMAFPAYEKLFGDSTCNAVFVRGELPKYDDSPESGFFYVADMKTLRKDLNTKLAYISNYIWIIIGISCLICIIVIFNLSVIFYRERFREYMILRTIGYSHFQVLSGSMLEVIVQAALSLLVGIPLGYMLSVYTVNAIGNDAIRLYIQFSDVPILLISAFILATAILGRLVASKGQIRLTQEE